MSIFTQAGDFIHEHIIQPIEAFFTDKVEPVVNEVEPALENGLLQLEQVGEKYFEQFADGIGADALGKAVLLINAAANLTDLGDVVKFAETIGKELVADAEKLFKANSSDAVDAAKNVILNAARTALTAAVVAKSQIAAANPPADVGAATNV